MKKPFSMTLGLLLSFDLFAQCSYLPQGVITAWAQDRSLWEQDIAYEAVFNLDSVNSSLEGLRVSRLNSFSFLYEAGLRQGDILLALNDVPVNSEGFSDELASLEQLPKLELTLSEDKKIVLINSDVDPDIYCLDE
jgi:type II secretory pathway component PulC